MRQTVSTFTHPVELLCFDCRMAQVDCDSIKALGDWTRVMDHAAIVQLERKNVSCRLSAVGLR